jgi:hypothetical protein
MSAGRTIAVGWVVLGAACGDRSGLYALGGNQADDPGSAPGVQMTDDASLTDDRSFATDISTAEDSVTADSSDIGVGLVADGALASLPDGPPGLPCLDRPAVACSCGDAPDVCEPAHALHDTIFNEALSGCFLACLENYFSFDSNGCLTAYTHTSRFQSDDACILEEFAKVRIPCAAGVSHPIGIYYSCTVM